jgi:4'-phosphopantetheinyl transferase
MGLMLGCLKPRLRDIAKFSIDILSTIIAHSSLRLQCSAAPKSGACSLDRAFTDTVNLQAKRIEKRLPTLWRTPTTKVDLTHDEIHVWRANLDLEGDVICKLHRTLSSDERARADRYHFSRDRDRFTAARGLLRDILGRYLNEKPADLRFDYGSHGKPGIRGQSDPKGICFNMSHSDGLGLYAVAQGREVGVDVERIKKHFGSLEIAERFFSPREFARLSSLSEHHQLESFFNCWTRKEAYIKARGMGLSLSLQEFDVSLAPGEPAALLWVKNDPDELSRWTMRAFIPASGYVAGLAVEGEDWRLKCWQWTDTKSHFSTT